MTEQSQASMWAEQATLGGLMMDSSKWYEVKDIIKTDDFLYWQHRIIYQAICDRMQAKQPVDLVTLCEVKELDMPYLIIIVEDTPTAANTVCYAEKVKEHSERYQLIKNLTQTLATLHEDVSKKPIEIWQELTDQQEKITTQKHNNAFMFESIKNTTIKPQDWLIEDFIEANSLAEVFGAPESGKSLLAIDWGLSVAAGFYWQGHRTKQGAVFYVAGEGQNGLARRFGAWCIDNSVDITTLPFYRSEQAAAFYDLHSAINVERAISQIIQQDKVQPRFIIIDTLARNFGGGNENSTEDMSQFVAHIDKHLRVRFNATVLLVHHTGHGSAERGRGSSALRAAVDTEYSMIKNDADVINLTCTKMKDAAHPLPKSFQIRSIELNINDEKGNPANGPVLIATDYAPPTPKTSTLGKNQKLGLSSLAILLEEAQEHLESIGKNPNSAKVTLSDWQERLELPVNRFHDVKNTLQEKGFIRIEKGFVYPLKSEYE
jgi:hypothetical protein